MMNDRRHTRKQPTVWHIIHIKYIRGCGQAGYRTPAHQEYAPLPGDFQGAQSQTRSIFWVFVAHTAKTNIYRRRTALEKAGQICWRLPIRLSVQEPVACDKKIIRPVWRLGQRLGTVTIQPRVPKLPRVSIISRIDRQGAVCFHQRLLLYWQG